MYTNRRRWINDALFRKEVRDAFKKLVAQGWTDAIRKIISRRKRSIHSGIISAMLMQEMQACALIIFY